MRTVTNTLELFLLVGLGLTYWLGLGWLVIGPTLHGSLTIKKQDISLIEEIPLALISGLIINYGIVICLQSLRISLTVGGMVSFFGICYFAIYIFRNHTWKALISISIYKWLGIFFVCLLYLSPILAQPLKDWDARSIWFFHAKMIYSAGVFNQAAGWQDVSVVFSHPDYPNLVPTLAAQVAYVVGFWNEYIPKISLFFMLVPAIVWPFTFARRSFSFAILLLLIPLVYIPGFGTDTWTDILRYILQLPCCW